MPRLEPVQIASALQELPGWEATPNGLERTFRFADFAEAFRFMKLCAEAAEIANHHPDWSNSYGIVRVLLRTHSEGGVTAKDIAMATTFSRVWETVNREST